MDGATDSEYIGLVVRLQVGSDGAWSVHVDGTHVAVAPLVPATFVIRVWRKGLDGPLRGSIGLHDSDQVAPFQSNHKLTELLQTWLFSGDVSSSQ